MARDFKTVGVVGLGTMGAGIAEVLARNGIRVYGVEQDAAALNRGRAHVAHSTRRAVSKGKLSAQDAAALLDRVTFTTDLADLAGVDLVIEAIPERLELKRGLFQQLDSICGADAIFATNTSSLSVTEISVATSRPGRVVGIHFFNPAPVMKLVEVVRTVVTEPEVLADVEALAARLGKSPVVIGDKAGFIANALLFGYLNHAATMYEARYASREDIDAAMRLGCRLPMGPLALLDLIGLDTAYEILDTMYKQSRDRLHAPAPILKQMKTAGLLGRKVGRGFYTYEQPGVPTVVPDDLTSEGAKHAAPGRTVDRVAVVGSGTMAGGIAEVCVKAGLETVQIARSKEKAEAARAAVEKSLGRAVAKGKLAADERDAALARLTSSGSLTDAADCDLVIEAVIEDVEVKTALFRELDGICKPGAVLATTTSSLPVIDCAVATSRPADVVGIHFFNPAPVMELVEVVHTVATASDVLTTVHELCERLGKHPVDCADRAGFIVNALLFPYLNDAVKMLQAHYATADGIDTAMKLGCGYPMGPFELLDVVGLDVALAIERVLYLEFREPGFAPAPLLEHLVTAGYLGRKTSRGFRDHTS
ncbi:3-hydroxybutyryl-CoA dehydrogenase [Actinospica sp.]|uniref:3-hydroxyacyl-CoA dehydrogenase family protein n=1 Tax=Actinospica sp. TaxID=1872142 RepID=UPI002C3C8549|nr:3-hydroxybutyryl-CoA dehydrogenase [Actinospica sp.]HWG25187.1 3-hydroxybutyryl-CoA dehydrogenase [Actinospica sp.]